MEDSDDNVDQLKLGEFENDEEIVGSNIEHDNLLLAKGRPTESSNNEGLLSNRFTIVENNFGDEPAEIKDDSVNISKNNESNNNSKTEVLKKKKKENKTDKKINFIKLKIILVGEVSVGKKSIVGRYINNNFDEFYKCTIQAEQQTKIIKEDENTSIKMNIWDTARQEKFLSLTRQYYLNCQGAIIVFDLTKKKSFEKISNWIKDIKEYGNDDTLIIILGNKSDLTGEREVFPEEIKNKLKEFNEDYLYYEVSAKNGNNISMAFDKLKKLIMENMNKKEEKENKKKEKNDKNKKEKNNKEEKRTKSKSLNESNKNYKEKNKKCC